jgi:glycosyltransferase involved in cell wall biosynthesis
MIVSFVFPSGPQWTGGVIVLYEMANGLARRGHEVHFIHGPANPYRVDRLEDLPDFAFEVSVRHHLVDSLEDPGLPEADVVMTAGAPPRLGLPAVLIQGYRMVPFDWERQAYRQRAPKLCVATWLMDVGRRFGVPPEQLLHVPLGLDHELFALITPLDLRRYHVAAMYNPHKEKGWDVTLPALRTVTERRPETSGVVFGMSRPPEALPDGIDFVLGPDQRTLADAVYGASQVFVQASHHEGFGLTAVEAMGCGCALVSTDNGGSRDYAIPDETAMVVPPADPASLADAVLTLLQNDDRRHQLAMAGERFVRRFDWDRSSSILEGHLGRYLADPERFRSHPAEDYELRDAG